MASYYDQFGLSCNPSRATRRVPIHIKTIESNEAFSQREQRYDQENKDNARLNAKKLVVIKELAERRWAQMYFQHLAHRVKQTDMVRIQFSDLPPIASLSVHDLESSSPLMYHASVEQHIEVLEQRRRDAQIGKETSWDALNTLASGLTSGNPVPLYLYR